LLGTVEVCLDGTPVDLGRAGAAKVRCLLAALLPIPGSVVPTDVLVDRVWGHQPPSSSLRYKYISWLRGALTPLGVTVQNETDGYVLTVRPECVDVNRFQRLLVAARAATNKGNAAQAAAAAREALDLWRGPALSGLSGVWAHNYRDQLDRQRRDAVTNWAKATLVLGDDRAVIDELSRWHTEYPADEAIAATLMQALHRTGQTSHALACYQTTRQYLHTELDASPGRDITTLCQQIRSGESVPEPTTRHDTTDASTRQSGAAPTRYLQQVHRIAPARLLERDRELAELAEFCTNPATAGRYLWLRAKAW
jgi:DNA-binding SARP family transcriptional activator